MIIANTEFITGKKITEVIGLVKGNTVRSRHIGRDILAVFKNIVGGEISDYTKLLAQSREQSLDRMIAEAKHLGADAIINVRFSTSMVSNLAAEIVAYGTAVRISDEA